MPITLPFETAPDDEFEPLEPGSYPAVIHDLEHRISPNSGKPYINITFKITSPEYENRRVYRSYSLQQKALPFLRRFLVAVGFDKEQLYQSYDLEPKTLLGKEVTVKLGPPNRDFNPDNTFNEVLGVLPAGATTVGAFD